MNVIELTIQPRKVITMELTVGGGGASYYEGEYEVTAVSGASQLVIKSPNGTKFAISVDDSGNLTTTKL